MPVLGPDQPPSQAGSAAKAEKLGKKSPVGCYNTPAGGKRVGKKAKASPLMFVELNSSGGVSMSLTDRTGFAGIADRKERFFENGLLTNGAV